MFLKIKVSLWVVRIRWTIRFYCLSKSDGSPKKGYCALLAEKKCARASTSEQESN